MTFEVNNYIDGLITKVLTAPGLESLPEEEKTAMKEKLAGHFQNLIIDTAFNRLTAEQVVELEAVIKSEADKLEDKMTELTATIPGLAVEIEERLAREVKQLQGLGGV
ncbi:MAG: hypothetical protein WDZ85_01310 [Candidatus Paceibacterota bacterium]